MTPSSRLHYIDNLRALAMVAGILFHAALAYSPLLHPYWLTADPGPSAVVDVAVWFLHLFRMPLFFAISGFCSAGLVQRRGLGGMLRNRSSRLLLPLLVCWPLISLSVRALIPWAANYVHNTPPLLRYLAANLPPFLPLGLGHLWFLAYLLLFNLGIWIVATIEFRWSARRLLSLPPAALLLLAPLLLAPALTLVPAPTPAPDGLLPQLWAVAFYGSFFAFGYALFPHCALLPALLRYRRTLLLTSLAAYLPLLALFGATGPLHFLAVLLEACISVWMTVWCLLTGQTLLHAPHPLLRYLAAGSYWAYLVHLPILFAVQFLLIDWPAPWPAKWVLSVLVTFAVCLLTWHWLPRRPQNQIEMP